MIDRSINVTIKMLCDSLDASGLGIKALVPTSRKTTYDFYRSGMLRLLTYLAMVNGECSNSELQYINECLGYNYTDKDVKLLIKNTTDFEAIGDEVPVFMKVVVNADNLRLKRNIPHGEATCLTVYSFFEMIGRDFLCCNELVDEEADARFDRILQNMRSYYEANDEEYRRSVKAVGEAAPDMQASSISNDAKAASKDLKDAAEDIGTIEELMEELHSLVGLEKVKKDVDSLVNLVKVMKMREERGMKEVDVSLHLVFSGNPGTGKTTVARLLSKLYCKIGVLSKGHLVEVDRSGLVSGYVGQTAIKTKEQIEKALGGVLFIDEAYALTAKKDGNDFGIEAVETLLKGMEDNRDDLAVIVAGYPDLMDEFLASNPGLKSRFNKFIYFDDYKPEELHEIFKSQCKRNGYEADDEALSYVKSFMEERYINRDENYANARDVRNFFEKAVVEHANRIASIESPSDEDLATFKLVDVSGIEL